MKTRRQAVILLSEITLAIVLSMVPATMLWANQPKASTPPPHSVAPGQSAYGHLPVSFEVNQGQTDQQVKFLSRGTHQTLFLTPTEAVFLMTNPETAIPNKSEGDARVSQTVLRMSFPGANPRPRILGREVLAGKKNYFIGNDPAKWQTNVPIYAEVQYQNLYSGIDFIVYGNQRQFEYDFIVSPGADPSLILLHYQGADKLEVDARGDLVLYTATGIIRQQKPSLYQEVNGIRQEISGNYMLKDKDSHQVGFQVGAYDRSRQLVIDPTLVFSTYLGGSDVDVGQGITVDAAGNAYITGYTYSANFPTTAGALKTALGGINDVFVTKINPTGSALVYSTYLGGSDGDQGSGIAVNGAGNAYVTGITHSTDFPTTPGAFQTALGASQKAFVTKIDPTGSGLVYSTYLGGSGVNLGIAIAVDGTDNAYVTGQTLSSDFPTTPGAFQTVYGGGVVDAFVTKVNPVGTGLVYSTYLGGSGYDGGQAIALDGSGDAYVTGLTQSTNFPTTLGVFQTANGGSFDGFVTKVNPTGTGLLYSTYLGGSGDDEGSAIAMDGVGNASLTGVTSSPNFPTTSGAFQTLFGGVRDAFVTEVNPSGTGLVHSTYLGGSGDDFGYGIAVDTTGNASVTGSTESANFPTTPGAPQTGFGGVRDAFVTKVNPTGTGLVYSTYLGGSGDDVGRAISLDALPTPNAYVAGHTNSSNFPTIPGSFQTIFGGGAIDAFVAKIDNTVSLPPTSVGKVTGGGTINVSGGIGNFGFVVQSQSSSGPISGDLQYKNHATGDLVHSTSFTSFTTSGNTATFGGTCTDSGLTCTFTVTVTDNGEPGKNDIFTISLNGGPLQGGTVRSGSVNVR